MDEGISYEIRPAGQDEWEEAMGLAWKTFLEFEAGDYTPEGVRSFEDFITDSALKRMFLSGDYRLVTAYVGDKMAGMITLRNECHISLLFVDKRYHRHGIGKALIDAVACYVKERYGKRYGPECGRGLKEGYKGYRMTVNASPYGAAFYHRIGFKDLGPKRQQDGIIFTPMEYIIVEG